MTEKYTHNEKKSNADRKVKTFKLIKTIKVMAMTKYNIIQIILFFWAYFFGIIITSDLISRGLIPIQGEISKGLVSILVGLIFASVLNYLLSKKDKRKSIWD